MNLKRFTLAVLLAFISTGIFGCAESRHSAKRGDGPSIEDIQRISINEKPVEKPQKTIRLKDLPFAEQVTERYERLYEFKYRTYNGLRRNHPSEMKIPTELSALLNAERLEKMTLEALRKSTGGEYTTNTAFYQGVRSKDGFVPKLDRIEGIETRTLALMHLEASAVRQRLNLYQAGMNADYQASFGVSASLLARPIARTYADDPMIWLRAQIVNAHSSGMILRPDFEKLLDGSSPGGALFERDVAILMQTWMKRRTETDRLHRSIRQEYESTGLDGLSLRQQQEYANIESFWRGFNTAPKDPAALIYKEYKKLEPAIKEAMGREHDRKAALAAKGICTRCEGSGKMLRTVVTRNGFGVVTKSFPKPVDCWKCGGDGRTKP